MSRKRTKENPNVWSKIQLLIFLKISLYVQTVLFYLFCCLMYFFKLIYRQVLHILLVWMRLEFFSTAYESSVGVSLDFLYNDRSKKYCSHFSISKFASFLGLIGCLHIFRNNKKVILLHYNGVSGHSCDTLNNSVELDLQVWRFSLSWKEKSQGSTRQSSFGNLWPRSRFDQESCSAFSDDKSSCFFRKSLWSLKLPHSLRAKTF